MKDAHLAQSILELFSLWAEDEQRKTHGVRVPILCLYHHGAGLIHNVSDGFVYYLFDNLADLITYLEEKE